MLLDANVLLYAMDSSAPQHAAAREWVEATLNGNRRVGIPWQTVGAVARIGTHPRVMRQPLTAAGVWSVVCAWLDCPVVWVPPAGERTARILGELLSTHQVTGNLVPDAQLAALALEHGLTVVSCDTDFARFTELSWVNPLS